MKKCILLVVMVLLLSLSVQAQGTAFIIQEESVEITIHTDSTVEIWYFITLKTTTGPQKGIYVGIPTDSIFDYAASQNGQMLTVEQEPERLKVWFLEEAQSGDVTQIKVSFFAEEMIYPDTEGRLGMKFIPAWWDSQPMDVLKVKFILPEGCNISEVGNYPETAQNRGMEGGKAFVYFERANLAPGYTFECGVSFPEKYVTLTPEKPGGATLAVCFVFFLFFIILMVVIFITVARKIKYAAPQMKMESLGPRKDLDPVEAAYVLNAHPLKLVNLVLLGLVRKGAVRILEWGPVKVEVMGEKKKGEAFNCPNCGAPLDSAVELQFCQYCGSEVRISGSLTSYENEFLLNCIRGDGKLNEDAISRVLETMYKRVDSKLAGYSRVATEKFYKDQIEKYWSDIHSVTAEDRYRLFGDKVDWLMADPEFDKKTGDNFDDVQSPYIPSSWWIWYNLGRASNGGEFSRTISEARKNVEDKSGLRKDSLEKSWEKHSTSGRPAANVSHAHKSCVCACVSCACACACVSCACACASGGGF